MRIYFRVYPGSKQVFHIMINVYRFSDHRSLIWFYRVWQ